MNKSIVITSIFHPTKAVRSFAHLKDYHVIVVGDKKTPLDWHCDNVDYLSMKHQKKMNFSLSQILPYNHYCRKMLGYLHAMQSGSEYIVDTDDDNIPKEKWSFPLFEGKFHYIDDEQGFINIYQLFTKQKIWPRGLPLRLISHQFDLDKIINIKDGCSVGVWQGLADEDPDVDAVYRLTSDEPCYFEKHDPVVLGIGTLSPFNTQNTIIRKELFALMYLPTYVTFRFTDILRSLVAQPIMWLYGYHLGFTDATVIQKRNPHNYMDDFNSEIPMYQYCEKVTDLVSEAISINHNLSSNIHSAYLSLLKENIICAKEMKTLEAWLNDVDTLMK